MSQKQNQMSGGVENYAQLNAPERDVRYTENLKQYQEKLRFLETSAAGKPELKSMLKDPNKQTCLVGLVQRLSDGSLQFISPEMRDALQKQQMAKLGIDEKILKANGEANRGVENFVHDTATAYDDLVKAVEDAGLGNVDLPAKANSLEHQDDFRKEFSDKRSLFLSAARIVIAAKSDKIGQEVVLEKLLDMLSDYLHEPGLQNSLEAALNGGKASFEDKKLEDILKILKDAASLRVFSTSDFTKKKNAIDAEIVIVKASQDAIILAQTSARQEWNKLMTGDHPAPAEVKAAYDKLLGESEAKDIIAKCFDGNILNFDKLRAALAVNDIVLTELDLRNFIGVPPVGNVEKKALKEKELIAFITSESRKVVFVAGGKIIGIWWDWIASLPDNVIPQANDKALYDFIMKNKALYRAKSAIETLETWPATGDNHMENAFKQLRDLQSEVDLIGKAIGPASTPAEKARQAAMLLDTAKAVYEDLEKGTNFSIQPNQHIRNVAFYLAMTKGMVDAKKYLENPQAYALQNPDLADPVADYVGRVNQAETMSGRDILQPMTNDTGIRVIPHALTQILSDMRTKKGVSLSVDDLINDKAKAGVILSAILYDDPAFNRKGASKALVAAYTQDKDQTYAFKTKEKGAEKTVDVPMTSMQASLYVRLIHQHLAHQVQDKNVVRKQLERGGHSKDLLSTVRTAMDTLSDMFNSGDRAEQLLAGGLAFGALYAIYRAWKAEGMWRNVLIGIPAFVGLDIAVKRATGKGVLDRMNMRFVPENERSSSLEQFVRSSRKEKQFNLDDEPGRVAVAELMNPKSPIGIGQLLDWRDKVKSNGGSDFTAGIPSSLRVNKVVAAIGIASANQFPGAELRKQGYETMLKALEYLCIQTADRNALGGGTPEQRAALGATHLRKRYVNFNENYIADMGIAKKLKDAAKKRPGGQFTMEDVLIFERPTPAVNAALDETTFSELGWAKLGVLGASAKNKFEQGASFLQVKVEHAIDQTPLLIGDVVDNSMESIESFRKWAIVSGFKIKAEVVEDLQASWVLLKKLCSEAGVLVSQTPQGLNWVFEKGKAGVDWVRERKALELYREMRAHGVTGRILQGFEAAFFAFFGKRVENIDIQEVSKVQNFRSDLVALMDNAAVPTGARHANLVNKWLTQIGIKLPVQDPITKEFTEKDTKDPAERMLRYELLKREIFSFMAADRAHEIYNNRADKKYTTKQRLDVTWPVTFDPEKMKFDVEGRDVNLVQTYEYIRSRYNNAEILSVIGQDRVLSGALNDYADQNKGTFMGGAADWSAYFTSFLSYEKAKDYTVYELAKYTDGLKQEAKEALEPDEYKKYEEYLSTLTTNVLLESMLSNKDNPQGMDLTLKVKDAQNYLEALRTRRGNTPEVKRVRSDAIPDKEKLLAAFSVPDMGIPEELSLTRNHPRAKWLLAGVEPPDVKEEDIQKHEEAKQIDEDKLRQAEEALFEHADVQSQKSLLGEIRKARGRSDKLREKFDKSLAWLNGKDYDKNKDDFHNYLQGVNVPNIKNVADRILPSLKKADDLRSLLQLRTGANDVERARIQYLIDRAVVQILSKGVIDKDPLLSLKGLQNPAAEIELMKLYKAAGDLTPLLHDTIAWALEFAVLKGDYSEMTLEDFNFKYLKEKPLPSSRPWRTVGEWFGNQWDASPEACERFKAKGIGGTFKALEPKIRSRLTSAESFLEKLQ
ncbi:hypothetical protein EXS65_03930 [Candidatus Peribacteria bacterium]|nr:hypothetical protein [Candidatus Peribacteria bacterium]